MKKNMTTSTTHSGIFTLKDLKDAIEKIKKIDPPQFIKTGSMKPIENAIPTSKGNVVGSIYGLQVIVDDSLQPYEYKIVYASGREEKREWK